MVSKLKRTRSPGSNVVVHHGWSDGLNSDGNKGSPRFDRAFGNGWLNPFNLCEEGSTARRLSLTPRSPCVKQMQTTISAELGSNISASSLLCILYH